MRSLFFGVVRDRIGSAAPVRTAWRDEVRRGAIQPGLVCPAMFGHGAVWSDSARPGWLWRSVFRCASFGMAWYIVVYLEMEGSDIAENITSLDTTPISTRVGRE